MVHACFDVMFHLQVLYPDGQSHVIHPKPGDFRKPGPHRHRLITQVYLSHTAWTGEFNTHTHTLGVLKKVVKIESLFFFFQNLLRLKCASSWPIAPPPFPRSHLWQLTSGVKAWTVYHHQRPLLKEPSSWVKQSKFSSCLNLPDDEDCWQEEESSHTEEVLLLLTSLCLYFLL